MKKYFAIIGIIIFILLILSIDISQLLEIISKVYLPFLLLVFFISVVSIVVRCLKWKLILGKIGGKISVMEATKYYFIGIALGIFTPARVGEFAKAFYTKGRCGSLSESLAAVVLERIIDIVSLFVIGVIALVLFYFSYSTQIIPWYFLIVLIVAFVAALFVFFRAKYLRFVLRPAFKIFVPKKYENKLKGGFNSFFDAVKRASDFRTMLISFIISVSSWILTVVAAYFVFGSLGLTLGLEFLLLFVPIITLLDLLPISISGIGTRDAAAVFLLSFQGIGAETAIAFSIIYLFVVYWLIGVIGALLFIREPVKISLN